MTSFHATALKPGFAIKEYVVEHVLGQGTFGITYKARDVRSNGYVAIKEYFPREFSMRCTDGSVIPAGNAEDIDNFKWGLEKFIEEATTLARFDHPNIISVKRFFEWNGSSYLVMDYCHGEPLDAILQREKTLDEDRIRRFLRPLLEGLELIHSVGVVHRDIKPGNLFIRDDGSPVLLDFGAARQEMSQHSHSRSMTSMATDGYAPIEQYSTRSTLLGPWSDIYGLASTLYRCVTGAKPQNSIDRQLQDELEPATQVAAGNYPDGLLRAIDQGMALNKEQRPQSIGEWRVQLFGVQATGSSAIHPVAQASSHKKMLTLVGGLAVLTGVLYGISFLNDSQPDARSTSPLVESKPVPTEKSKSSMPAHESQPAAGSVAPKQAEHPHPGEDTDKQDKEKSGLPGDGRSQRDRENKRIAEEGEHKQRELLAQRREEERLHQEEQTYVQEMQLHLQEEERRRQEEEMLRHEEARRQDEERRWRDTARRRLEEEKRQIEEERRRQELVEQRAKLRREAEVKRLQSLAGAGPGPAEYALRIAESIKRATVFSPSYGMSNLVVEYSIDLFPDGSLRNVTLVRSSGVPAFDQAVRRAIDHAAPFPPDPANGAVPPSMSVVHRLRDR